MTLSKCLILWAFLILTGGVFPLEAAQSVDLNADGVPDLAPGRLLVTYNVEDVGDIGQKRDARGLSILVERTFAGEPGFHSVRSLRPAGVQKQPRAKSGSAEAPPVVLVVYDPERMDYETAAERVRKAAPGAVVEPDVYMYPQVNDPFANSSGTWEQPYADQWYLDRIRAHEANDLIPADAPEVVVAVLDSGVDRTHPDLQNVMWTNSGEIPDNGIDDDENGYVDDVEGWGCGPDSRNVADVSGHGTAVAGVLAAGRDDGVGMAGVASGVRILPVRVEYQGRIRSSDVIEGLYYAAANGARVVNMSVGTRTHSTALFSAVSHAYQRGVVLVASAGNEANDDNGSYPAAYREVVSVGATDLLDQRSPFSNHGIWVDLMAPGGGEGDLGYYGILLPRAVETLAGPKVDQHYIRSQGTSYAAPMVAAGAALLLRNDPTLTPAEVRQLLILGAEDVGVPDWDNETSFGRLDLVRSLELERPATLIPGSSGGSFGHQTDEASSSTYVVMAEVSGESAHSRLVERGVGKTPDRWTAVEEDEEFTTPGRIIAPWAFHNAENGTYSFRVRVFNKAGDRIAEARSQLTLVGPEPELILRDEASYLTAINVKSPTLADLDGDGLDEILVPHAYGVRILRAPGGGGSPPAQIQDANFVNPGGPAVVGDIDGDGQPEIGLRRYSPPDREGFQDVIFWNLDGSVCEGWPLRYPLELFSAPEAAALADMDRDGVLDVVFTVRNTTTRRPEMHVVDGRGDPLPGWPVELDTFNNAWALAAPAVADVDGNGEVNILICDSESRVHVLDRHGRYLPGWPTTISDQDSAGDGHLLVTDLDGDGWVEIVILYTYGTIGVLDPYGDMRAGWPVKLVGTSRPSVGDVDGDGVLEIGVGTAGGEVYLFRGDGGLVPGFPKLLPDEATTPCFVDLDGDGAQEVVVACNDKTAYAWGAVDRIIEGFPFSFFHAKENRPSMAAVEDFDGDGRLEFMVRTDRVRLYRLAQRDHGGLKFLQAPGTADGAGRFMPPAVFGGNPVYAVDDQNVPFVHVPGKALPSGTFCRIGTEWALGRSNGGGGLRVPVPGGLPPGRYDLELHHPHLGSDSRFPPALQVSGPPMAMAPLPTVQDSSGSRSYQLEFDTFPVPGKRNLYPGHARGFSVHAPIGALGLSSTGKLNGNTISHSLGIKLLGSPALDGAKLEYAASTRDTEEIFAWDLKLLNRGPVVRTLETRPRVREGEDLEIKLPVYDIDGDVHAFRWYLDGVLQEGEETSRFTLSTSMGSPNEIPVRVEWVESLEGEPITIGRMRVQVVNDPPVLLSTSPSRTLRGHRSGDALEFRVEARDPESNPLVYRWEVDGKPVGGNADTFLWQTKLGDSGSREVTVRVVDNRDQEILHTWNVVLRKPARNDFDGDRRSDIGVYHPETGAWFLYCSSDGFVQKNLGGPGTTPVTGDFDGDDLTDLGVYSGPGHALKFEMLQSSLGHQVRRMDYLVENPMPLAADLDGDGTENPGYYNNGRWLFVGLPGGEHRNFTFGFAGTTPVSGDLDGDGTDDFGCYFPPEGAWYFFTSSQGFRTFRFGFEGTVPVVGDLDGDGKDDVGCYHAPSGNWFFFRSAKGFVNFQFGFAGTIPVVGDYDGDGLDDVGCYYPPEGLWFIFMSREGFKQYRFGFDGTLPVR